MRRAFAIGIIALTIAGGLARADEVKVKGRVVDAGGRPVAGAEVGSFWNVAEDGTQRAIGAAKTDADGRFVLKMNPYGRDAAVMALDGDRKSGGVATVAAKDPAKEVEVRLGPVVRVHGTFTAKGLKGDKTPWTNVIMSRMPGGFRIVQNSSKQARFAMTLPVGEYAMHAYGADVDGVNKPLTLKADVPDVDLGAINLPPTIIARHRGQSPPPWTAIDARGIKKGVSLDDLKGKWVLVDFWGHWCGPCVRQLGDMIDFYDEHKDHRDKFEIVAFHDATATDFADMDRKLAETRKTLWRGRDLPFPVLLDAPSGTTRGEMAMGTTVLAYGINHYPTTLLIDPEGRLVGEAILETLEAKLPALPMARRAARALDRDVAFGFDTIALDAVVGHLARMARIPITLDVDAMKTAGIDPKSVAPLTYSGSISLRSMLDLLVAPFGLSAVAGETGIVVTVAKPGPTPTPSEPQRLCADRIAAKLAEKTSFDFKDATLAEVASYFESRTSENFVLDPASRKAKRLDPNATVTGAAKDVPLRDALTTLLKPLGLAIVVKDEVVVFTAPATP